MGGNEESKEALLVKDYYENCPGCQVDQRKQLQRGNGIPIKELVSIWIVVLCVALPISSLFPFLYFMVRDFHIAKKEEDISYYAGFIGSSFMIGRALTSVFWGVVADRYGRKPVIIMGTATVVVFNGLFGLSVNFWMAISTRFLLGFLNGLLGPIKAYAVELFNEEYQALGLSAISTSWGTGLIIGPALGGFLAQVLFFFICFLQRYYTEKFLTNYLHFGSTPNNFFMIAIMDEYVRSFPDASTSALARLCYLPTFEMNVKWKLKMLVL